MLSTNMHYVLVSLMWIFPHVKCQWSDNTPPIMSFNRKWVIEDTEPVGTVIIRVTAENKDGDQLTYGLEPTNFLGSSNQRFPFRIDSRKGVVYLNESIKGRAGEKMFLYVTATEGGIAAKTEVLVQIVDSSRSGSKSASGMDGNKHLPHGLPILTFNSGQPPASIFNNPRPYPGQNTYYPRHPQNSSRKDGVSIVAVKTHKENATEKEQQDLLTELQVIKMLEAHPNVGVVKLMGCSGPFLGLRPPA